MKADIELRRKIATAGSGVFWRFALAIAVKCSWQPFRSAELLHWITREQATAASQVLPR
jgi:hypothetical protein